MKIRACFAGSSHAIYAGEIQSYDPLWTDHFGLNLVGAWDVSCRDDACTGGRRGLPVAAAARRFATCMLYSKRNSFTPAVVKIRLAMLHVWPVLIFISVNIAVVPENLLQISLL